MPTPSISDLSLGDILIVLAGFLALCDSYRRASCKLQHQGGLQVELHSRMRCCVTE